MELAPLENSLRALSNWVIMVATVTAEFNGKIFKSLNLSPLLFDKHQNLMRLRCSVYERQFHHHKVFFSVIFWTTDSMSPFLTLQLTKKMEKAVYEIWSGLHFKAFTSSSTWYVNAIQFLKYLWTKYNHIVSLAVITLSQ